MRSADPAPADSRVHPETAPAEPIPSAAWWVLAAVGMGTFMSALDSSVVNVALPIMGVNLGVSVARIEWVVTVYLLVVSGTLLGFGRLGDLRGHKRAYIAGFAIFVSASILCGTARDANVLIAFRALQALGAAMLFSNSPAIITMAFPPTHRGRALGLQATLTYLGLTLGPPLGGFLTRALGWPAIFFINVPVGLAGVLVSWRVLPDDRGTAARGERFDFPGAGLFFGGLIGVLFALNQGHVWGWGSGRTLALLGTSILTLATFVVWERRSRAPMLDLSLFESRTFSACSLAALLNYVGIYAIVFIMPFYLIQGRGLPAEQAGLMLAVQSVVMAVTSPLAGALSDRIGSRRLTVSGMLVLTGALIGLSITGSTTPLAAVATLLGLAGLGTGLFVSPNNSALLGAAPRARLGIASGVLAEARNVGMVLGVGLAGAVFTTLLAGLQPGPNEAFFAAVRASLLAAGGVTVLAALVSLAAGQPQAGSR